MKNAYFNWSSGKDSALALYKILQQKEYQIDKLVTTVNADFKRVSMHGLSIKLLKKQVEAIGIPLETIEFPAQVSMELYSQKMYEQTTALKSEGYEYAVFGDIFLEDLRAYRDEKLSEVGLKSVYPLWKQNTKDLLSEFLDLGFKAITVCTNANLLGKDFVGRIVDSDFIKDLPSTIDVCGEHGEFHTFCFDGPIFKNPIDFKLGEKVQKSYTLHENEDDNCFTTKNKNHNTSFWYCDLIP